MNKILLIGRTVKDVELKNNNDMSYANFSIAINRGKDKDGNDKGADFPYITTFGKTAENLCKYIKKGSLIAVEGHIKTSSYEKDGKTIYSTGIIADKIEFLEKKKTEVDGEEFVDDSEG